MILGAAMKPSKSSPKNAQPLVLLDVSIYPVLLTLCGENPLRQS